MRLRINRAVGVNQPNNIVDVKKIQILLNRAIRDDNIESLKEDGLWGPKTFARLVYFQKKFVHLSHADAVVNRYGPTFRRLNHANGAAHNETSPHQRQTALVPDSNQIKQLAQRASLPLPAIKSEWINRALPAAINVKRNWGVPIAVTIAQGALESGWGHIAPGNVYFGVKGKSTEGKSINITTHEEYGGTLTKINDSFRSYDSLEQSADDYGRFLNVNKRFAAAFSYPNDPEKFIHEVAKAGYATDSNYEKKILNIIRTTGIKDYDTAGVSSSMCYINPLHYFSLLD
ncbi:flagellar biosynthesis protein FlgJ [Hafnia paralvei]|uniref:glucosaminidase domain-containing protein n=1 Tax=Hafnia paralvei TaxID=546367 RepID=UPI00076B8927|nr:glucosaminidase domain-containing protein [Hafnia paralvei]AMH18789.1 flagellar biosynthesis protein FlgJ [Hafnia paralvei]MCK2180236.1 glucosaminidase domain-containing protein [Hafnia paralvei]